MALCQVGAIAQGTAGPPGRLCQAVRRAGAPSCQWPCLPASEDSAGFLYLPQELCRGWGRHEAHARLRSWRVGVRSRGLPAEGMLTCLGLGTANGMRASMGTTQGEMVVPKLFPRNGPRGTYSHFWMSRAAGGGGAGLTRADQGRAPRTPPPAPRELWPSQATPGQGALAFSAQAEVCKVTAQRR